MPAITDEKRVMVCPHCEKASYAEDLIFAAEASSTGPTWACDDRRYELHLLEIPKPMRIKTMRWLRKNFDLDLDVAQAVLRDAPCKISYDLDLLQVRRFEAEIETQNLPIVFRTYNRWGKEVI